MNAALPPGPPPGRFHGNHAIVIGASIGGLLAARVLSAHFDRVTVFDRDTLPSTIDNRRGGAAGQSRARAARERAAGAEGALPVAREGSARGRRRARRRHRQPALVSARLLQGEVRERARRPAAEPAAARGHGSPPRPAAEQRAHRRQHAREGTAGGARRRQGCAHPAARRDDHRGARRLRRRFRRARHRGRRSGSTSSATASPRSKRCMSASATRRGSSSACPSDLDGDMGAIIAPRPPQQTSGSGSCWRWRGTAGS